MPRGRRIESPVELARREPYRSIIQVIGHIGQKDPRARTQEAVTKALTRNFKRLKWKWLEKEVRRLRITKIEKTDTGYPLPTKTVSKPSTVSQSVYAYLKTLVDCGILTRTKENGTFLYELSDEFAFLDLIDGHIGRLEMSKSPMRRGQVDVFCPQHIILYSGSPFKLDPESETHIWNGMGMIMSIAQHIWGIHWRAVDQVLQERVGDVLGSSLPSHIKDFVHGVFRNTRLTLLDRYDRWSDYSGGTSILLKKAMDKLGVKPEEVEWISIADTLIDGDGGAPHSQLDDFLDDFSKEEVGIAWLLRRFFGDLREWNIGLFEVIDDEVGEKPTNLTEKELDSLYDYFEEDGVKKETLDSLRYLYHLIGEDFDPHIVVGPQLANSVASRFFTHLDNAQREFAEQDSTSNAKSSGEKKGKED